MFLVSIEVTLLKLLFRVVKACVITAIPPSLCLTVLLAGGQEAACLEPLVSIPLVVGCAGDSWHPRPVLG